MVIEFNPCTLHLYTYVVACYTLHEFWIVSVWLYVCGREYRVDESALYRLIIVSMAYLGIYSNFIAIKFLERDTYTLFT